MSNYIQFKVNRLEQKIDGQTYKMGDLFDYDPELDSHKTMYDQGVLIAEKVTPKTETTSKKKSRK